MVELAELGEVIVMDLSAAAVTLNLVDPEILPTLAVIVVSPTALPIKTPLLETVSEELELIQVTPVSIGFVEPSE